LWGVFSANHPIIEKMGLKGDSLNKEKGGRGEGGKEYRGNFKKKGGCGKRSYR